MPMDERRYFTVDEANALVPRLEVLFARIMRVRTQLKSLYRQLEELGHAPTLENLQHEIDAASSPEVRRAQGMFKALVETLGEDLAQIEAMGALVKNVEIGLCDFWARREGEEVLLCWQYGEKAIEYFHTPEAGFAGRRPLDPRAAPEDKPGRTLH